MGQGAKSRVLGTSLTGRSESGFNQFFWCNSKGTIIEANLGNIALPMNGICFGRTISLNWSSKFVSYHQNQLQMFACQCWSVIRFYVVPLLKCPFTGRHWNTDKDSQAYGRGLQNLWDSLDVCLWACHLISGCSLPVEGWVEAPHLHTWMDFEIWKFPLKLKLWSYCLNLKSRASARLCGNGRIHFDLKFWYHWKVWSSFMVLVLQCELSSKGFPVIYVLCISADLPSSFKPYLIKNIIKLMGKGNCQR